MSDPKTRDSSVTPEEVADEVATKVRESVLALVNALREPSGERQTITIDELEQNWDILDKETKKTYAELVGKELSGLNEKPLIESKK
jgi:hypothetical protein